MTDPGHAPVLVAETLRLLEPLPGETAVDCTAGRGGHALALAGAVGPEGLVVGFDLDPDALAFTGRRVTEAGGRFEAVHASFVSAPRHLAGRGLRADVVLADLGFGSWQMDDPARGFSFSADGPLDMRYDPAAEVTAEHLLATLDRHQLADVIGRYGEEPLAGRIARRIVETRARDPVRTTAQLADLVREAYGPRARDSRMHPATRTFMALRIAVNEELAALQALLDQIDESAREPGGWLNARARIAIISFHSLEDRLVKHAFADLARTSRAERLTKRPVTASPDEIATNPRSRSAKLRAVRLAKTT